MADLQYIGARYVPKFYDNPDTGDNNWKSGVGYEPLTVVTYNNDTYTSKKTVPSNVGNPSSNPAYWVKTGNYNAALESLQASIKILEDNTSNGSDYIYNKKILFVGDSYGVITDNWPSQIVSLLGIDAANYQNVCVSGSGLLDTNVDTWLAMVTRYNGAIPRDEITDIIICGGINDMRSEDAPTIAKIRNALWHLIQYCRNNFNHARIYVGFIGWVRALNSTGGEIRNNIGEYGLPAYHEVETWGATYLTGVEAAVHDARLFDSGENTHPNSNGERQIALAIIQAWLGGGYHKTTVLSTGDGSTFNTVDYTPSAEHAIYSTADGYGVNLYGRATNVDIINNISVNAGDFVTLTGFFTHLTSLMIGSNASGFKAQDTFDLPIDLVYAGTSELHFVSAACSMMCDGTCNVAFHAPITGTIGGLKLKAFQRYIPMYGK